MDATDEAMNIAVGAELRRAREAAGLTRSELAAILPFKASAAGLSNYETGKRMVSHWRMVEFCRAVDAYAPDVLGRAIESVESIQTLLVELDLRAIADDDDARFAPIRTWARNRLARVSLESTTVRVHHSVVRELAVLLDMSSNDLVKHLASTASFRQVSGPASTSS
ncbi:helix-turn-helix domain-containing protein [Actinophytocola sp.]|uniref:helix-turn-helix domain-containing protein n=1 Tax=Actinophytocola sp. TaxID=1872138 RepID=UPI003D6AE3B1